MARPAPGSCWAISQGCSGRPWSKTMGPPAALAPPAQRGRRTKPMTCGEESRKISGKSKKISRGWAFWSIDRGDRFISFIDDKLNGENDENPWRFGGSCFQTDLDADVETSRNVTPTATRMVIACTTFPTWSNPVVTTKPTHVANPIIKPIFERRQLSTPRKWIQMVKMRYQGYSQTTNSCLTHAWVKTC